jgi:hypothetical protein
MTKVVDAPLFGTKGLGMRRDLGLYHGSQNGRRALQPVPERLTLPTEPVRFASATRTSESYFWGGGFVLLA